MNIHTITSKAGKAHVIVHDETERFQSIWAKGEFFEYQVLEHIRDCYSNSGGTFIDAGSQLGNHALFFAKFCNIDRVIAIEPVEFMCRWQRQIYALNDVADRIHVHNCALSNKGGRGKMERFGPNLGQFHLMPGNEVRVETLDSIVDREHADDVNIVKLDVEQHELRVLQGAARLLSEQKPALFIEIWDREKYPDDYSTVTQFLAGFGYEQVGSMFEIGKVYEFAVREQA